MQRAMPDAGGAVVVPLQPRTGPAGPPSHPERGPLAESVPRRMRSGVPATAEVRIARDKIDGLMLALCHRGVRPEAYPTRTLAVRLGDRAARITYTVEMILAILLCTVLVPQNPWFALIFVLVGPTVYSCVTVLSGRTGKDLIPVLKQAGIVALAYSLLMGLAVFLGNFSSLS